MHSISVNGETIVYEERGDASPPALPLVFVSGLAGTADEWLADMHHFGASRRCLSLEHPGIGGTPLPSNFYGAPQMADRIAAGLGALGVESAAVLGMSMGGAVAQELALRHPQLVERLVLVSTFSRLDARSLRAVTTLVELLGTCETKPAMRMFYWLAFGASYFDRNLDALDTALDEYLANPLDQGVFAYQLEACRAHDVRDRLGAVACPALIVHGAEDLLVRPHHARELNAAIPASEVVFLEEGGHCCNWEQPERFRDEVDAFLGS